MTQSSWVNPNGLPAENQITSARDLAILARALLHDFPEYDMYWHIPAIKFGKRVMRNYNTLIGRYDGADGMKTGFICASGFNLVASATRHGKRLIAVVLGSPSSPVSRRQGRRPARARLQPRHAGLADAVARLGRIAAADQRRAARPARRDVRPHRKRPAAEEADDELDRRPGRTRREPASCCRACRRAAQGVGAAQPAPAAVQSDRGLCRPGQEAGRDPVRRDAAPSSPSPASRQAGAIRQRWRPQPATAAARARRRMPSRCRTRAAAATAAPARPPRRRRPAARRRIPASDPPPGAFAPPPTPFNAVRCGRCRRPPTRKPVVDELCAGGPRRAPAPLTAVPDATRRSAGRRRCRCRARGPSSPSAASAEAALAPRLRRFSRSATRAPQSACDLRPTLRCWRFSKARA